MTMWCLLFFILFNTVKLVRTKPPWVTFVFGIGGYSVYTGIYNLSRIQFRQVSLYFYEVDIAIVNRYFDLPVN